MSETMRAMVFRAPGAGLHAERLPVPQPARGEVLLQVEACGVCRTDLHLLDGELPDPRLPVVPGHQIVGRVVACGAASGRFRIGERVGVPWLGGSCGECAYCARGEENLCARAVYTGCHRDGGFAEFCVADERFCFPIPAGFGAEAAAPLLCAGLIGYRAWRCCAGAGRLGLYGFGAAAHILAQFARAQGQAVYAFTRPGDASAQAFARGLGACWAGSGVETPPEELDAAIIFAPDGALVPAALRAVRRGGTVVCGGIHMSDIPAFPYALLWGERQLRSIANLTRRDGEEFLPLAAAIPVRTEVHCYPLAAAGTALEDLRHGRFSGAAVVVP